VIGALKREKIDFGCRRSFRGKSCRCHRNLVVGLRENASLIINRHSLVARLRQAGRFIEPPVGRLGQSMLPRRG
jgi:hypothetical protein